MTTQQWQRIKKILDAALDLPQEQQRAYISTACPEDSELQRYVERLLQADADAPAFLDVNAAALLDADLSKSNHEKDSPMDREEID